MGSFVDLTGREFERLTVLRRVENSLSGNACWLCICACGNTCVCTGSDLTHGRRKSCGCSRSESLSLDLTGRKYGRLTVLARNGKDRSGLSLWRCICECGNTVITRTGDLQSGKSNSCGCLKLEQLDVRNRKHSMTGTRPYRIWKGMKTRCFNSKVKSYVDYGGRGIQICEAWKNSFDAFWTDMASGYADNLEIDRINHDGDYCFENCRWVDKKTQNRNTRQNHIIDTSLGRMTMAEYAERSGQSYDAVKRKVYKAESAGGNRNAANL